MSHKVLWDRVKRYITHTQHEIKYNQLQILFKCITIQHSSRNITLDYKHSLDGLVFNPYCVSCLKPYSTFNNILATNRIPRYDIAAWLLNDLDIITTIYINNDWTSRVIITYKKKYPKHYFNISISKVYVNVAELLYHYGNHDLDLIDPCEKIYYQRYIDLWELCMRSSSNNMLDLIGEEFIISVQRLLGAIDAHEKI